MPHLMKPWTLAAAIILFNGPTCFADATGTGFVLSRAGYINTNYHVIADAVEVQVITSDGRTFTGVKVLRRDITNDLAMP